MRNLNKYVKVAPKPGLELAKTTVLKARIKSTMRAAVATFFSYLAMWRMKMINTKRIPQR